MMSSAYPPPLPALGDKILGQLLDLVVSFLVLHLVMLLSVEFLLELVSFQLPVVLVGSRACR